MMVSKNSNASSSEEEETENSSSCSHISKTLSPKKSLITKSSFLDAFQVQSPPPNPNAKPLEPPVFENTKTTTTTTSAKREAPKQHKKNTTCVVDVAADEVSIDAEEIVKKPPLFKRLFSEEDEIALLKGILKYAAENGVSYNADLSKFYDFIKKSIHFDVTKLQLKDKINKMKQKYKNNEGRILSDEVGSHEKNVLFLSKQIWGEETTEKPENHLTTPVLKNVGDFFVKNYVDSMSSLVVEYGLDMVSGETRKALEKECNKVLIAELEVFLKRKELISKLTKLVLKKLKSEDE